jgi:hypothetical protein
MGRGAVHTVDEGEGQNSIFNPFDYKSNQNILIFNVAIRKQGQQLNNVTA